MTKKQSEIVDKYKFANGCDYSVNLKNELNKLLELHQEYLACLQEEKDFKAIIE